MADADIQRLIKGEAIRRLIVEIEALALNVFWCAPTDQYGNLVGALQGCFDQITVIKDQSRRPGEPDCPPGYTQVGDQCIPNPKPKI